VKRSIRTFLWLLGVAVVALAVSFVSDAGACPNVTQLEVDRDVRNVALLEKDVQNDDFAKARTRLLRFGERGRPFYAGEHVWLHVEDYANKNNPSDPNGKWAPVAHRAFRLNALIFVRDPKSTAEERAFARRVMLDFVRDTQDPTLAIDAAEVFSHFDDLAPVALMMIRGPAEKDLVGSAWAYAALARMEKAHGNTAAETSARERCRRMAKHPTICEP